MPTPPTSGLEQLEQVSHELKLLDEKGRAPKTRVVSAKDIRAVYEQMLRDDEVSAVARIRVQGMKDGEPPYNPAARRAAGQSSLANANFLQGDKIITKVANGYNDILFSVKTLMTVNTEFGEEAERFEYNRVIAEELTRTIRKWPCFAHHFMMLVDKFVTHGVGISYFPDTVDWRFEVSGFGDFLIPRQTPASEEKIQIAVSKQDIPVTELFGYIRDEERAKGLGWDTDAVKRAVNRATDRASSGETGELEALQREIKNNDLNFNRKYQHVRILRALVREFDGSLSFYILEKDGSGDILCSQPNKFKNTDEAFVFFCYGIGNGTFHGIRGLGHILYPLVQLHNRLMCMLADSAMLSGSVMIQPESQKALDELSLNFFGPLTVLSPGAIIQEKAFPNLAQSSMPVLAEVKDRMAESGSMFTTGNGGQRGEVYQNRLASEAQMEELAGGNTASIDLFYASWDRIIRQMVKRIINGPKSDPLTGEFHRRMEKLGIPKEALRAIDHDNTYATRAIGAGSPAFRTVGLNRLMQLLPNLDEIGQKRLIYQIVADVVGYQNAGYYAAEPEENRVNVEAKVAEMENILILQGNPIGVNAQELHATHAMIHVQPLQEMIEGIERGTVDPMEALPGLRAMLQHLGEHAEALAQDPAQRNVFGIVKEGLNNITQIVNNFERAIRAQERQGGGAPAEGGDPQDAASVKVAYEQEMAQLKLAQERFKLELTQQLGQIKIAELQAKSQQSLALNDARGAVMAQRALSAPGLSYRERM
jgi:hypothetical protein